MSKETNETNEPKEPKAKKTQAIKIYTDGSSENKKEVGGKGACGYVAIQHDEIIAEHIEFFQQATSIRAELVAMFNALTWARTKEGKKTIFTDSRYCADGFNNWMHIWRKNDWKKANGQEVSHADVWRRIYRIRNAAGVRWIKAHSGNVWNEYIDRKVTIRKDG
jgi:ribonuclease HI